MLFVDGPANLPSFYKVADGHIVSFVADVCFSGVREDNLLSPATAIIVVIEFLFMCEQRVRSNFSGDKAVKLILCGPLSKIKYR